MEVWPSLEKRSDLRNDKMCERNTHGRALLILIDPPDKQGPELKGLRSAGVIIPTGLGRSLLVNMRRCVVGQAA